MKKDLIKKLEMFCKSVIKYRKGEPESLFVILEDLVDSGYYEFTGFEFDIKTMLGQDQPYSDYYIATCSAILDVISAIKLISLNMTSHDINIMLEVLNEFLGIMSDTIYKKDGSKPSKNQLIISKIIIRDFSEKLLDLPSTCLDCRINSLLKKLDLVNLDQTTLNKGLEVALIPIIMDVKILITLLVYIERVDKENILTGKDHIVKNKNLFIDDFIFNDGKEVKIKVDVAYLKTLLEKEIKNRLNVTVNLSDGDLSIFKTPISAKILTPPKEGKTSPKFSPKHKKNSNAGLDALADQMKDMHRIRKEAPISKKEDINGITEDLVILKNLLEAIGLKKS